MTESCK